MLRQAADDHHPLAERLERLEDRRELERSALSNWRPVVHAGEIPRDAVRQINEGQTTDRPRGGSRLRGQRRDHGVEQRQRERRAHAAQERSPVKMSFVNEHGGPYSSPFRVLSSRFVFRFGSGFWVRPNQELEPGNSEPANAEPSNAEPELRTSNSEVRTEHEHEPRSENAEE